MSASSRPPTLLDYLLELDFLPQNEGAWFDRATAGRTSGSWTWTARRPT